MLYASWIAQTHIVPGLVFSLRWQQHCFLPYDLAQSVHMLAHMSAQEALSPVLPVSEPQCVAR